MTSFEKKPQKKIARVKVMKGGHTSGWVKVLVRTEYKLYLDDPITKLKKYGLSTACKIHEFNVRLITDLYDYENKDDLQVQLKIPSPLFKVILDHDKLPKQSNNPRMG